MALINIPTSGIWSSIANALNTMFTEIFGRTGWANYVDTQYTSVSPLILAGGVDTDLPNNKLSVIESQKPTDVTTFYDGSVITGRNGDGILISVEFTIKPTAVGTTLCEVWMDITGGAGTPTNLANLYRRAFNFPKGVDVARKIIFSQSGYTLNTWEANGAVVEVRTDGNAEIYDISYIITRTHKAR